MALSGFASKLGLTKKKVPTTSAPTAVSSVTPADATKRTIAPVKPSSTPQAPTRSAASSSSGMKGDNKQTIEFKVCVMGGHHVGKSSLLRRYCQNTFHDNTTPTIAFDVWSHVVPLSQGWADGFGSSSSLGQQSLEVLFSFWDISYIEINGSHKDLIVSGVDGILLVADGSDDSIRAIDEWRAVIAGHGVSDQIPIILVITKQDIYRDALPIKPSLLERYCTAAGISDFKWVTSRHGRTVNEAVDTLLLAMMQRHRSLHTVTEVTEHGTSRAAAAHGLFATPLAATPVLSIAIPPSMTVIHPATSTTPSTTSVPDRAAFLTAVGEHQRHVGASLLDCPQVDVTRLASRLAAQCDALTDACHQSQSLPSLWEELRTQEASWLRLLRPLHLMKALQAQSPSSVTPAPISTPTPAAAAAAAAPSNTAT